MQRLICCLLLVIAICFAGCSLSNTSKAQNISQNTTDKSFNTIETIVPNDMNLKIFYLNNQIYTNPLDESDLIEIPFSSKIVINSPQVPSLLEQLKTIETQQVKESTPKDIRLYYYFELRNGEKLLEVSVNGRRSVFVNGEEIEYNPVYFDIVAPYLEGKGLEIPA